MDQTEIVQLTRRENNRELTVAVYELEAKGGWRITSRTFRSFMATRVRSLPGIRVDHEQCQLWLGHLGQDTTAHYEIADGEHLREAAAATAEIIRQIDQHCTRSPRPKARDT